MNNLIYENKIPGAEEYLDLRSSVGWPTPDVSACRKGLPNSAYCVTVRDNGKLIGMGRIIGDGVFTFFIVDIIVQPDYQRKNIGTQIMNHVMNYLEENAALKSYITLMAAKGKEPFYEKYGFFKRPTEKYGCGMMLPHKSNI